MDWQHPDFLSLLNEAYHDPQARPILKDWLLDQGVSEEVAEESNLYRHPLSWWNVWSFPIIKIGRGSGRGRGSGIGSGRGSGIGRGIGRGSGNATESYRSKPMRIGQAYLVHCGDWHTFCGRVISQLGPGVYEMDKVSKVAETNNGDCWEELAAGNESLRAGCTYKHYTTRAVLPLTIAAFEWVGKLPQES